jgi:hypothetical protein
MRHLAKLLAYRSLVPATWRCGAAERQRWRDCGLDAASLDDVALSGDILAVGAWAEDSAAQGVGGNQNDNSATDSGAVYVFRRTGTAWQQEPSATTALQPIGILAIRLFSDAARSRRRAGAGLARGDVGLLRCGLAPKPCSASSAPYMAYAVRALFTCSSTWAAV